MIQPQWPGLGPIFSSGTFGRAPLGGDVQGIAGNVASDGVGTSWWNRSTTTPGVGSGADGASMSSVLQQILGLVGQLVGMFMSSAGTAGSSGAGLPAQPMPNGPQQRVGDVDLSSTGDPHLAETGTAANGAPIDDRFDSMSGHGDLVSARSVAGGYRVSTAVTQPGANGVTFNDSATVHANGGADAIAMQRDGTFSVISGGSAVTLTKGQSEVLAGGETVTENQDGALAVSAGNGRGGTIATTLRATGQGVDVTTHAHDLAVGGDIVRHALHARHVESEPASNAAP